MKVISISLLLFVTISICKGEHSPSLVDSLIETLPYDNPVNIDSILLWADRIESTSSQIGYQRGINYASRFRAYHYDFKGDFSRATEYYLEFLKSSRSINHRKDELSAISDLVYIYVTSQQNIKAKSLLTETIQQSNNQETDPRQLSTFYNNLGIVYKREEQLDSAAWAYNESLTIKQKINDLKGISDLRINLSSLYNKLGDNEKALQLVEDNLLYLGKDGNPADIIYNLINKGAALMGLNRVSEAEANMLSAVNLAEEVEDIGLLQLSTSSLAELYYKIDQHKKAYDYLIKSQEIKSQIFNEESNIRIAELREAYEADKREQDNNLLTAQVEVQKSRLSLYALGLLGLSILLSVLTWFWRSNKAKNILLEKKNDQIQKQNQKLTLLNTEKNNLMSMVSHDLSTPFSTIKIWAQGLNENSRSEDIIETKDAITQLSDRAIQSIGKVLTIDDTEISKLELNEVKVSALVNELVQRHQVLATHKSIKISSEVSPYDLIIMSDRNVLDRVLDNLLSNAVKYSNQNGRISVDAKVDSDMVIFKVTDDGVGIDTTDQQQLFDRYSRGSIKPTSGESSHGLGLSIAQRLVDELGGLITVKSELGEGSVFTIRLPL